MHDQGSLTSLYLIIKGLRLYLGADVSINPASFQDSTLEIAAWPLIYGLDLSQYGPNRSYHPGVGGVSNQSPCESPSLCSPDLGGRYDNIIVEDLIDTCINTARQKENIIAKSIAAPKLMVNFIDSYVHHFSR